MMNRSFFSNLPIVTRNLLIVNIIIWAFMAITPDSVNSRIMELGGLHYFSSPGFGVWQFFTYMFIHANFMHLFFNMWGLLMFGMLIEQSMGSKRFLFYYITCGLGAALAQMGVYAYMIHDVAASLNPVEYSMVLENGWNTLKDGYQFINPTMAELNGLINGTTVGASGAIFGILIAVAFLFPNLTMFIMFLPFPVKAKWMVLGYGIIELFQGVVGTADGVAHFAHLGGLAVGFLILCYWRYKYRKNGHL